MLVACMQADNNPTCKQLTAAMSALRCCLQSFWSRLAGKYGTKFYVKEKGEAEAILNAVSMPGAGSSLQWQPASPRLQMMPASLHTPPPHHAAHILQILCGSGEAWHKYKSLLLSAYTAARLDIVNIIHFTETKDNGYPSCTISGCICMYCHM